MSLASQVAPTKNCATAPNAWARRGARSMRHAKSKKCEESSNRWNGNRVPRIFATPHVYAISATTVAFCVMLKIFLRTLTRGTQLLADFIEFAATSTLKLAIFGKRHHSVKHYKTHGGIALAADSHQTGRQICIGSPAQQGQ